MRNISSFQRKALWPRLHFEVWTSGWRQYCSLTDDVPEVSQLGSFGLSIIPCQPGASFAKISGMMRLFLHPLWSLCIASSWWLGITYWLSVPLLYILYVWAGQSIKAMAQMVSAELGRLNVGTRAHLPYLPVPTSPSRESSDTVRRSVTTTQIVHSSLTPCFTMFCLICKTLKKILPLSHEM